MLNKKFNHICSIAALTLVPSCGYQIVHSDMFKDVSFYVPKITNRTEYIGLEAELNQKVREKLHEILGSSTSEIANSNYKLALIITAGGRSGRVWSQQGGASLGLTRISINYSLSNSEGKEIKAETINRKQDFLSIVGENTSTAFQEAIADIAEQIVIEIAETIQQEENV